MDKPKLTKPLQIYMPQKMLLEIKVAARHVGATASAFARQAIMEKITRDKNLSKQQMP